MNPHEVWIEDSAIVGYFLKEDRGNNTVTIRATDEFDDFAEVEFELYVKNNAPIFNEIDDQVAHVNVEWMFTKSNLCSDLEDDKLTVTAVFSEPLSLKIT